MSNQSTRLFFCLFACLATAVSSPCPAPAQSCDVDQHPTYVPPCSFDPADLAFPEAEGFGASTAGGRCGRVVVVTRCDDADPPEEGMLRHALRPPGVPLTTVDPRTVVFQCAGIIDLVGPITIERELGSHITIAGETAPGDGVLIEGFALNLLNAHDIITRHLRLRNEVGLDLDELGCGIGLRGAQRIVVDHCSISWSTDEALSAEFGTSPGGCNENVVFSNNYVAEVLLDGDHPDPDVEFHSRGMVASNGSFNLSAHHNYLVSNYARNPSAQGRNDQDFGMPPTCPPPGGCQSPIPIDGVADVRHNVVYNWASKDEEAEREGFGVHFAQGADVNIFGNILREGPDSREQSTPDVTCPAGSQEFTCPIEAQDFCCDFDTDFYVAENCEILRDELTGFDTPHCPEAELEDPIVLVHFRDPDHPEVADRSLTELGDPPDITPVPAGEPDLVSYVLNKAGALPHDFWDERFFAAWRAWEGDVGTTTPADADGLEHLQVEEAIGFEPPEAGTPWPDADGDGINDDWESAQPPGCYEVNPAEDDTTEDCDLDGYTDLEDYLHALADGLENFYADEFEDGARPPAVGEGGDWTYEQGDWVEQGGELVGTRAAGDDKARAIADTFECQVCRFEATLRATNPTGGAPDEVHTRLLAWYQGPQNHVSLTLEVFEGQVTGEQKKNGQTKTRFFANLPFGTVQPDVDYDVMVEYIPDTDRFRFWVNPTGSDPDRLGGIDAIEATTGHLGVQGKNADILVGRLAAGRTSDLPQAEEGN